MRRPGVALKCSSSRWCRKWRQWGIRVNAIAPGDRTPINTKVWQTPEACVALMTMVPYKRIGEPEDIGRAAAWLGSDASDYATGTSRFVDSGMTLFPGFSSGG